MALQPLDRPAGSTQVLRFSGLIRLSGAVGAGPAFTTATYPPKSNGEAPSDIAANTPTGVRFLLADATAPTNAARKLPSFVFDDSVPAAVSPTATFSQVIANVTNASDQLITTRTWAENTYITVEPKDSATAAALVGVDVGGAQFCLDVGASSGLGLNTGLPVLILPIISANAAAQWVNLNVDILIEVRHTASR
jgi:hypothetical protein